IYRQEGMTFADRFLSRHISQRLRKAMDKVSLIDGFPLSTDDIKRELVERVRGDNFLTNMIALGTPGPFLTKMQTVFPNLEYSPFKTFLLCAEYGNHEEFLKLCSHLEVKEKL